MIHPKDRWDTCYYMSSTSKIAEKYRHCFGYIFASQRNTRPNYMRRYPWCLDNDVFNKKFNTRVWIKRMRQSIPHKDTCLFIVTPDVIGDHKATLAQFPRYAKMIRKFGYPVALVSQDGLTPDTTPWDDFECLFVGGTDEHKLGREAGLLIDEAIRRGKWVHIGRVNSPKRMRQFWRADSWDGTHIGFEPDKAAPKMAKAVMAIRAMKKQQYKLWESF